MSELIIKDVCPHCGKKTIVYMERRNMGKKSGSGFFGGCQHCDGSLKNLLWRKQEWFVARMLKPMEIE